MLPIVIMGLQEVRAAMADMECATDIPMDRRWQALLALVDSGQIQAPVPQHIAPASIMSMESIIFDYMRDPEPQPNPEVAGLLKEYSGALTDEQAACVERAFSYRASLIYGPGGSGKTMTCDAIAYVAEELGIPIRFSCHAWLAAEKVNQSVTSTSVKATSILSFVYQNLRSKVTHGAEEGLWDDVAEEAPQTLPARGLMIVDEASMVDTRTLAMLICILRKHSWRLVLIGDDHQLPPISFGQPFRDLVQGGNDHVVLTRLTKTFRTRQPNLVTLHSRLRASNPTLPSFMKPGRCEFPDLVYNTKLTPQGLVRAIQDIVRDVQSRDRLDSFQIIAAGKEHGPLSTRRINVMVAEML